MPEFSHLMRSVFNCFISHYLTKTSVLFFADNLIIDLAETCKFLPFYNDIAISKVKLLSSKTHLSFML